MKLRYIDLLRCVNSMKLLSEKENIPFSDAFIISKNIKMIDASLEQYFKQKSEIDNDYLINTEENNLTIKSGCEETYLKLLTELNEKEIEINIQKISLPSLSNILIAPKHLESITFMLE